MAIRRRTVRRTVDSTARPQHYKPQAVAQDYSQRINEADPRLLAEQLRIQNMYGVHGDEAAVSAAIARRAAYQGRLPSEGNINPPALFPIMQGGTDMNRPGILAFRQQRAIEKPYTSQMIGLTNNYNKLTGQYRAQQKKRQLAIENKDPIAQAQAEAEMKRLTPLGQQAGQRMNERAAQEAQWMTAKSPGGQQFNYATMEDAYVPKNQQGINYQRQVMTPTGPVDAAQDINAVMQDVYTLQGQRGIVDLPPSGPLSDGYDPYQSKSQATPFADVQFRQRLYNNDRDATARSYEHALAARADIGQRDTAAGQDEQMLQVDANRPELNPNNYGWHIGPQRGDMTGPPIGIPSAHQYPHTLPSPDGVEPVVLFPIKRGGVVPLSATHPHSGNNPVTFPVNYTPFGAALPPAAKLPQGLIQSIPVENQTALALQRRYDLAPGEAQQMLQYLNSVTPGGTVSPGIQAMRSAEGSGVGSYAPRTLISDRIQYVANPYTATRTGTADLSTPETIAFNRPYAPVVPPQQSSSLTSFTYLNDPTRPNPNAFYENGVLMQMDRDGFATPVDPSVLPAMNAYSAASSRYDQALQNMRGQFDFNHPAQAHIDDSYRGHFVGTSPALNQAEAEAALALDQMIMARREANASDPVDTAYLNRVANNLKMTGDGSKEGGAAFNNGPALTESLAGQMALRTAEPGRSYTQLQPVLPEVDINQSLAVQAQQARLDNINRQRAVIGAQPINSFDDLRSPDEAIRQGAIYNSAAAEALRAKAQMKQQQLDDESAAQQLREKRKQKQSQQRRDRQQQESYMTY